MDSNLLTSNTTAFTAAHTFGALPGTYPTATRVGTPRPAIALRST